MPTRVADQSGMMAKILHVWSPRLRLVLALSAALVVALFLESMPALRVAFQPLEQFTAMLAFIAIKATGLPIAIDGVLLTHPDGFRVAISYGCTPLVPTIFLGSVLTLGLSLRWRERLVALTSGIALITFLNLFRVAALYYIGVFSPGGFDLAHEWLGQGFIVVGTAIVVGYWISASVRIQSRVPVM